MRYSLIILLAIFLASCNNSENSITSPTEEEEQEGGVAFTFSSSSKSKVGDFPEPTNVRVLIRRFENDELKFNALTDVEVPTDTTVVVNVPSYDDFQIDAISYIDSSYRVKTILKADQATGISVSPDKVTQVSLNLEPVSPTFSIPDTVEKGENFNVTADFDELLAVTARFSGQYISYLQMDSVYQDNFNANNSDYSDFYTETGDSESPDLEWEEVSISEFEGRDAYFRFTTDITIDEFYQQDEYTRSFIFNYPNPYQTDTLKTFVIVPEGGIGVDVNY